MSLPISNTQLRVLRAVAGRAHRASTAQRAASETLSANRSYQRELRAQRRSVEQQVSNLDWETDSTRRAAEANRLGLTLGEIDERLRSVEEEIARLQFDVSAATSVSAPLNAVVRAMLEHFRAEPAELGILFGDQDPGTVRDVIEVGHRSTASGGAKS